MTTLTDGLSDLKPYQLRERATLIDIQIKSLQDQISALRDAKKAIRDEQGTRTGAEEDA